MTVRKDAAPRRAVGPSAAAVPGVLGRNLLLGITGSVGALYLPHIVYLLRRHFEDVHVILSKAAAAFVTPYALRIFSGRWVFTEESEMAEGIRVPHIELPRQADVFLVMPATANVPAKAAHGIADDLITTSLLACEAPTVFVPSMNPAMWRHPAVKDNVRRLRARGAHVMEPSAGFEVSSMEKGGGAMAPLDDVLVVLQRALSGRRRARPGSPARKRSAARNGRASLRSLTSRAIS